ncbi:MAG: DUF1801 domain-containing protein [Planctomycetota bacterium]
MAKTKYPFEDPSVERAFSLFPETERVGLMALRELIFDTARKTEGVGELLETLKWGQPAYLTPATKSGSTLRLGCPKQGGFAVYAHCQTTIISDFQSAYPDDFNFEGNRAVHFKTGRKLPLRTLEVLVRSALTYHLRR